MRWTVLIASVLVWGATSVQAKPVRVSERLAATAAAPGATGRARLVLKSDMDGRLRVAVRGLSAHVTYGVVLGGVQVAALETNGGGKGRVRLSTAPKRTDARLGADPRGETVVIRDPAGNDMLAGKIEDGTDPGAVACCLPDDDDVQGDQDQSGDDQGDDHPGDGNHGQGDHDGACAVLSPDQCTTEGGTVAGVDSCIPNPCDDDDAEIVCCLPGSSVAGAFTNDDEDEGQCRVGCEKTSAAECAAFRGTVIDASSCEANPCAPVPATDVVACCVPRSGDDEGDAACEEVTLVVCATLGGQVADGTCCHDDACDKDESDDGD